MKVTVIAVGKIKEKYLKDAIAEYSKRLGKYCKLEIIETVDEKTPDNASEAEEELIRTKEAQRILKHIRPDAYVVTLEIEGEQMASEHKPCRLRHRRIHRAWERGEGQIRPGP